MKLSLYMKSGNVIQVSGIKDWKIEYRGNEVTSISIKYGWWKIGPRLVLGSLDLSQIEAMVKS